MRPTSPVRMRELERGAEQTAERLAHALRALEGPAEPPPAEPPPAG